MSLGLWDQVPPLLGFSVCLSDQEPSGKPAGSELGQRRGGGGGGLCSLQEGAGEQRGGRRRGGGGAGERRGSGFEKTEARTIV